MSSLTIIGNVGQSIALLLTLSFIYGLLTPVLQRMKPEATSTECY